jgi:peptide-methionine (S)-S-oxide reductase
MISSSPAVMEDENRLETATFAAGCFWGVEATFRQIAGVVDTVVGYTGGQKDHPTYGEVCSGMTGHAEAVQISFDPARVSYEELLGVFWTIHDPTRGIWQGLGIGSSYRSAIFYHTRVQKAAAEASKERVERSGMFGGRPVATEIVPASTFWRAEEYHQRYFEKHGVPGPARSRDRPGG